MADNEPTISNPTQKEIGRRQALKTIFGIGAGAATIIGGGAAAVIGSRPDGATLETYPLQSVQPVEVQGGVDSPENRLERNGLKDFIPIYRLSVGFVQKYGILPPLFQSFQNTLIAVANGNGNIENTEEFKQLSGEWGTKREELPQAALHAFEQLKYSFDPSVSEKEQTRVKGIAKNVCQTFPMLAVAAPEVIEYGSLPDGRCGRTKVLGCTDGDTFLHAGNNEETGYAEVLIHELNHNLFDDFDKNPDNFQYVTKQETTGYFEHVVTLIDRFYTAVTTDSSEKAGEYMFGYNNWDERQAAITIAEGLKTMLNIDTVMAVDTTNSTSLPESPAYNLILRKALQRLLFDKDSLDQSEREQLSALIGTDMKFVLHALHEPILRDRPTAGSNSNAIVQQFLDLSTEYQRGWVPFVSSGKISGTTSISDLRKMCGLSPDVNKNYPGNDEIPQMFDYGEFGCTKRGEGRIEENVWYELNELPECPYDKENKYMAWEIFDPIYSSDSRNHILLFSVPKQLDVTQLQVSFEDGIASLTFPDGKKLTAHVEIKTENDIKRVNIDSTTVSNEEGNVVHIWDKNKKPKRFPVWTRANIGEVGPLGKMRPASNVPCVLTSDPNDSFTHYYSSGDNRPKDKNVPVDMAFFGETAVILPTEKGFQLLFRGLPNNLIESMNNGSTVEQVLEIVKPYDVELLGKDHFTKLYTGRPFKAKLAPEYHKISEEETGIIYSVVVGSERNVHKYPLVAKETM